MNKPVRKIGLILLVIIILPLIAFIAYQLSSLNEDEEVIRDIYSNQLDAILFSVNQYSEDIVSTWAGEIENYIQNYGLDNSKAKLDSFVNSNSSISLLFASDKAKNQSTKIYGIEQDKEFETIADQIISANSEIISRLQTYIRGGYRKIEPIGSSGAGSGKALLFLAEIKPGIFVTVGMLLDPENFVTNYLQPKLQSSAQNKFIINVTDDRTDQVVYSTESLGDIEVQQKKPLWLIPNHSLGIVLKGRTIDSLVRERLFENIFVLSLLGLVLIVGVVLIFRTTKKEIELAQIKSDFVSNVSHELRTPLALISMFAETLEMGRAKTEEKKKEYYSIISQEANRLSRIVNSILNFSRMEAGKREFKFSSVNLNEIVDKVLGTYDFHLHNKGFEYKLEKDDGMPAVDVDAEAVSEAFINILDNAVKYSGDQKIIEVSTGRNNENVFVEVRDFGIGISSEHQKKIFDKFFRVQTGLEHNTKGTGLGLALVKHIVDSHKGNIELKSELNKGTTVRLLFPLNKNRGS